MKRFIKSLSIILVVLFIIQSCQTKKNKIQKLSLENCDELNIVYYSKDTFVFKTFDTSSVNSFVTLITYENENITDTCQTTGQLIFKNKGQQILVAQLSINNGNCNNITYFIDSKKYRHRLTYRTGMGIDGIYWHKVDPKGNPWTNIDSSKFHYEEIRN